MAGVPVVGALPIEVLAIGVKEPKEKVKLGWSTPLSRLGLLEEGEPASLLGHCEPPSWLEVVDHSEGSSSLGVVVVMDKVELLDNERDSDALSSVGGGVVM
jgi:hypothetical protein